VGEGQADVTAVQQEHRPPEPYPEHYEPPHGPTWRLFFGGGLARALWMTPLFFLLGMYLTVVLRWWWDWHPTYDWTVIVGVGGMIAAPVGFLAGIGAFDYWLHYISGRPTRPEDHSGHGAYSWKDYFRVNTDHKVIGIQYLVTTFFFFLAGGLMAMLFRAELARPGLQFLDSNSFNGLVSVHATLMIFLFVIPAFAGIANFVVPLMLGAPDMAFPRLNALSYWLLPIAGTMFLASFIAPGGAFAAGWTGYAPLSVDGPVGNIFFNMGVQWAGASSVMTALNFLVTIITMRAPGMTFWRMPLLVWANFTTSLLVVIATPFIAGSQFFVFFDRVLHTDFFTPSGGGYALGYQHIFWFYSHPAVYIMMLPGFGIVSEVISTMARKPIFGYRLMALSLVGILVLGFSVWAHHMFVAGMANWLRVPMMITTLLIAVPTGIKIFSWIATLWRGRIHLTTPMLFALGFVTMFTIGGLSGIYLGSVPIDIAASDTYFIVAHIHYVLFGGSVFTIFAGIYYWFPKMTGRMYDERLGKLHFWLTFVSFNATFFPMHYVGLRGMPRRVFDYKEAFGDLNFFITVASFVLGASVVVFIYNMMMSWAHGPLAEGNPWRSHTLEWQVSSPPPVFNFDEIPQVVGGPYEYGVPGARHAVLKTAETHAGAEVHA
jgi:cytochrome c oxidase subunit 1